VAIVFLAVVFGAILFFDVITLVRYLAGKFGYEPSMNEENERERVNS
jgi:hypothetical protein